MTMRFLLLLLLSPAFVDAQTSIVKRHEGVWQGMMSMYKNGVVRDSVSVRLTIKPSGNTDEWIWKTEYLSPTMPAVKDYKLRLTDASKNLFVMDEGGGLLLTTWLCVDRMYNVFETGGFILTSTTEFRGDRIYFEVTSGKREKQEHPEVTNIGISNVQRVLLTRVPAGK